MPIRGEGLVDEDAGTAANDAAAEGDAEVSYVLHPNCGLFDDD